MARATTLAWRHLHRVPRPVLDWSLRTGADLTWLLHGRGIRRLEQNLARVCPELDARALRRLSRQGMRSYLRYYGEAFTVAHVSPEQLAARVRLDGDGPLREHLAQGTSAVLALGHLGNWDLAGAWAEKHLAPVTTVAERLKPPELYEDFLAFRTGLGMRILTFGDDGVFGALQRDVREPGRVIPLLADRDLGRSGVEVDFFGHRARVAAGPALLALSTGAPLYAAGITYERLSGDHRRRAGTPWGIVVTFHPAVRTDDLTGRTRERVSIVTQRWVDDLSRSIQEHPEDWHMLQRVFVDDLDPARYERMTAEQVTP